MNQSWNLEKFVDAQSEVYDAALDELRSGRKESHWMWFIFPQLAGLGRSPTARFYAITSVDEASAYLAHPVLGSRLKTCTDAVNHVSGRSAHQIFGSPDDLKFRSSMTLFAAVSPPNSVFAEALDRYFEGEGDPFTLQKLAEPSR